MLHYFRLSRMVWSYLVVSGTGLLLYGLATWTGWVASTATHASIPGDVRTSPGGYRSFHFWHSGYQGGK